MGFEQYLYFIFGFGVVATIGWAFTEIRDFIKNKLKKRNP
jgi:hypothetical protein